MASSSLSPHLLLFFFLLLTKAMSQSYSNISLDTIFTPLGGPTKPSPSGDFAFGFRPLDTDPTLFLLAVYFDNVPNKTIVWSANGDTPCANQSKAELTADGQLSLKDPTGQEIWNAGVNTASYAAVLDTGNLVLVGSDSGLQWQSFDKPTDTILPWQVLSQGAKVYSKLTDDDYSRGRFELSLQSNGNLGLYPVAYPSEFTYEQYWSSMSSGSNSLVFNGSSGSMYLSFLNGTMIPVLAAPGVDVGQNYLRATLDPDGVFRQYVFPKSSKLNSTESWTMKNYIGGDICSKNFQIGSGSCGFNSYCILDADGRSNCQCPDHYSFIDEARKYKGCKPDFAPQICEPGGERTFDFTLRINVDWPLSDAEQFSPMNETECTDNCLKDCFCLVAIYNGGLNGGTCWKKKLPLSNGKLNADVNRKAFIKYSTVNNSMPAALPDSGKARDDWKTWFFVAVSVLGGSVVLNFAQVCVSCFVFRCRQLLPPNPSSITGPALRSFTYKELEEATKGFSEELGKGAFGTVYKGVLPSQPITLIAVKKLEESLMEEAEKDFANEVATIGHTHHKNLVRLFGFCKEGAHRLMVFEFMSGGSLNKFLFGSDRPEWNRRVQIALGIAGGLAYLHEECRTQIIHCDIKPQNILLDDNLDARISDFGLAKLLKLDQTRTSTGIRGTIGYFAPEWFKNIAITTKVDVYSFGVMLLEIVCCRRNFEWGVESQQRATVIDWAKECCRSGRLDLLVEDDEEAKTDGMRLERFVMVGISCVQDEPWLRPSMKKVMQMLEGAIPVSIPPNMYSIRS